ncbi:MAG: hypothetical protein ACRD3Q_10250, partial [Terriglobales bacterium]
MVQSSDSLGVPKPALIESAKRLAQPAAPRYTLAVAPAQSRLSWLDWMRGLACLLMFQTHCYDSWLGGEARNGRFLHWSQRLGTFPAPL